MSTGVSATSREWNKKTKRMKGNSERSKTINEALSTLETEILSITNKLYQSGCEFSVHKIKEIYLKKGEDQLRFNVSDCFELFLNHIKKLMGKDYTKSTYFKYRITMERTMQFIRMHYKKSDMLTTAIDDVFLMEFDLFLRVSFNNSPKTIHKHIQRLKTCITFSEKSAKIVSKQLHYSVKVPPKKVEYLTQHEVDFMESVHLESERLTIIRDIFLFACYTGLGYSELKSLHKDHLKIIDDQVWIFMIRKKTKRQFKLPLLPKCLDLLEKYRKHKACRKGLLLPVPSNQRYNEYLKELNPICNISIPLTTHLARRTFACSILLRNGVHIQIVSQLLGHANTSITMKSYLSEVPELMLAEFQKIKKVYSNAD